MTPIRMKGSRNFPKRSGTRVPPFSVLSIPPRTGHLGSPQIVPQLISRDLQMVCNNNKLFGTALSQPPTQLCSRITWRQATNFVATILLLRRASRLTRLLLVLLQHQRPRRRDLLRRIPTLRLLVLRRISSGDGSIQCHSFLCGAAPPNPASIN